MNLQGKEVSGGRRTAWNVNARSMAFIETPASGARVAERPSTVSTVVDGPHLRVESTRSVVRKRKSFGFPRRAEPQCWWPRTRRGMCLNVGPSVDDVRRLGYNVLHMSDTAHDQLYEVAEQQAGYFTAGQAESAGMDRTTLRYHARPGGRFERVRRGLYRLRHFPSSPHEHVVAAWLPLKATGAVISHESALDLYGLADVIPSAVHVSIPRAKRGVRPRTGVRVHTLEGEFGKKDIRFLDGVPVTSPERTLVDALEDGSAPEQIELAIRQAVDRGLTTPRRLREVVEGRSARTRLFIESALGRVPA